MFAQHSDKEAKFSIRANDQYRIEFTIDENLETPVLTVCNITELSNHTGIAPSVLNEVLNGKRSVTTEYALLIEAALDIDADMWIGLQADYDKQKARHDKSFLKRLEEIRKNAAVLLARFIICMIP